jgi:thiamine-monophosphate kinase
MSGGSGSPKASEAEPRWGEFEVIERFFDWPWTSDAVRLGVGDDGALVDVPPGECLVVSTDMLVAGRHFFTDVAPESLGHKALAVNLSDLAAMGARPLGFTLALALPAIHVDWLAALTRGMSALAMQSGCPLLGGDTSAGPLTLSVTVLGAVPGACALRRDAARVGDDIWVSGSLGAPAWLLRQHVQAREHARPCSETPPPRNRLDWPEPRLALGQALRGVAHAAIDVSDGLVGDLGHVLRRSSQKAGVALGATLSWPCMPVDVSLRQVPHEQVVDLVLAGGDEYELLFTAARAQRAAVAEVAHQLGLALTRIGEVEAVAGVRVHDGLGRLMSWSAQSYDHFR